jgi:hypothetical protein
MLLSITVSFTQLRARESGAAFFRNFAGSPATLRGFFSSPVYQWSAPVFASSLLRASPQSETFSYSVLLSFQQLLKLPRYSSLLRYRLGGSKKE